MRIPPLVAVLLLVAAGGATAESLEELVLIKGGDPRAFFFRSSEGLARSGRVSYEEWERALLPLNGIMGKVLDEEIPNTSPTNIPFFTRFKQAHPNKAVLLHFNGNARDPRWECGGFFAGHWLYLAGCGLTADVSAEAGESTLAVENPALFRTGIGRYGTSNMDLGLCVLGPDGKPDWSQSEQLELLAVDAAAKKVRVRRGAFGTTPRAFTAGRAYLAPHAYEGPWGRRSNLLWLYNYATTCPRDAQGRTATDVLVEDLARRFLPGGTLASLDGLEFDVLAFYPHGGAVDCNADGTPDNGVVNGINVYGVGVVEFCRRLRQRLGPGKLILADGHSEGNQRAFTWLNGIESEGWPTLSDWEVVDWSGGLNRHHFWRANAHAPAFSYINHKYVEPRQELGGEERAPTVPPSTTRLVLAAALFTDSAFTYSLRAPAAADERVGIYDELRMGTARRTNWLGRPLGPATHLAARAPDLLRGEGKRWSDALLQRLRPEHARLTRAADGSYLVVSGPNAEGENLSFVLPELRLTASDLWVHLRIKADPLKGYPPEVARLAWVGWRAVGDLMRARPLRTGMAVRGKPEGPILLGSGATVRYSPAAEVAGERHPAYFTHPPYLGGVGYVYWEAVAAIPTAKPRLSFLSALGDRARSTSDGVLLKVEVLGADGPRPVLTVHQQERRWVARTADLSPWAGQQVRLRFTTDVGPNNNSVADQAYWGEVKVVSDDIAAPRATLLTPTRVMTWANGRWFEAGFYFRDLGPGVAALTFEFEGTEPVYLADLTLHAHPDALCRRYERGMVLANPSSRPYAFQLNTLSPGMKLRRLQGSPNQDPTFNHGGPAGAVEVVGPRDALFLANDG
ncbi:MAG: hypothetical protein QHJ73_04445 [Armatimonadota bacterium]|nr:hypothetical protein [Armatimonadota bacterium]